MFIKLMIYTDDKRLESTLISCGETSYMAENWPTDLRVVLDINKPNDPKSLEFTPDAYSLLLTDDMDILFAASKKKDSRYHKIVSLTKPGPPPKDVGPYSRLILAMDDVWPTEVPLFTIKIRMNLIMQSIRNEYLAWKYKNLMSAVINSIPEGVWYKDVSGEFELTNKVFDEKGNGKESVSQPVYNPFGEVTGTIGVETYLS